VAVFRPCFALFSPAAPAVYWSQAKGRARRLAAPAPAIKEHPAVNPRQPQWRLHARRSRRVRPANSFALALCSAACSMALWATPAHARCIDEEGGGTAPATEALSPPAGDAATPRLSLQGMVRAAIDRSNAVGAARLLAEAAASDVEEARAGRRPAASLSGTVGAAGLTGHNIVDTKGAQVRATFSLNAPLYDGGRVEQLTGWRKNLQESARLGQLTLQEQITLQTVSLALDRSRYRLQAQVYQQYARKMSCLVDALQTIVNADKGRTSELLQAKKTLQQAELAQSQTLSQVKQVESRLSRYIGNALPDGSGMAALLLEVPPLDKLQADAGRASEIAQLEAQTRAAESYARAVAAGQKPQLNWLLSGSQAVGNGTSTSVTAGVAFSVPLLAPGSDATLTAVSKRAEAARLQLADALEARRYRIADVHEQATSAFERARLTVEVVRNSDKVRNFTLQQWQQLGRRSLFDVMAAESEHYNLRINYVNALHDGEQANALLRSLGLGMAAWLD